MPQQHAAPRNACWQPVSKSIIGLGLWRYLVGVDGSPVGCCPPGLVELPGALALCGLMVVRASGGGCSWPRRMSAPLPFADLIVLVATFFNFLPSNIGGDVVRDRHRRGKVRKRWPRRCALDRCLGLLGLDAVAALGATAAGSRLANNGRSGRPSGLVSNGGPGGAGGVQSPLLRPGLSPLRPFIRNGSTSASHVDGVLTRFAAAPGTRRVLRGCDRRAGRAGRLHLASAGLRVPIGFSELA